MIYLQPGTPNSIIELKKYYGNFIGGEWAPSLSEKTFEESSPINGQVYTSIARSGPEDVERALDAAHKAKDYWGKTSVTERSSILLKIADVMEANLEKLALVESWGNGKPIRETLAADLPLCIDHWRYFAAVIRGQEGGISEIDSNTVAYHYHEPIGVVGQIIPWNFPLLMATWKLAPALAAGNTVVLKPAEQTPVSVMVFLEMIADLLPPGVVNVVQGFGEEVGRALASSPRIGKIAFTGETSTGQDILKNSSKNLIPSTMELGGKSPNIFFADIMNHGEEFLDKTLEGFAMFAFNQGEVCTCPSRVLLAESIFDKFMELAVPRVQNMKVGNPLDTDTMIGAQASTEQMEKIKSYLEIGKEEGAKLMCGGNAKSMPDSLSGGCYVEPTVFVGDNKMRIFQEEIFGPVVSVTKFDNTVEQALEIANDTRYGLGAAVWSRDTNVAYRMARGLQAGRVWSNCYHLYPAHAAFGGYKDSGFGRESHLMMLQQYQQTKNVISSFDTKAMGFF